MTSNQIAYTKFREEMRHNQASEAENFRHDVAMEDETFRSNVAREQENSRANTLNYNASIYNAQASMYNAQLNAQTQRYVQEQKTMIENQKLNQTYFNNDVINAETHRHNVAMEHASLADSGSKRISSVSNILNTAGGLFKIATAFMA